MGFLTKTGNRIKDRAGFLAASGDHPDVIAEVDWPTWKRNRQAERDAKSLAERQARDGRTAFARGMRQAAGRDMPGTTGWQPDPVRSPRQFRKQQRDLIKARTSDDGTGRAQTLGRALSQNLAHDRQRSQDRGRGSR